MLVVCFLVCVCGEDLIKFGTKVLCAVKDLIKFGTKV